MSFQKIFKQGIADAKRGRTRTTLEAKAITQTPAKPNTDKPWRQTTPRQQSKLIAKNAVTTHKADVEAEPLEKPVIKKPVMSRSTLESLKTKMPIRTYNLDEIRSRIGISKKSTEDDND